MTVKPNTLVLAEQRDRAQEELRKALFENDEMVGGLLRASSTLEHVITQLDNEQAGCGCPDGDACDRCLRDYGLQEELRGEIVAIRKVLAS